MKDDENNSIKWYTGGQDRAEAAANIMMDLVANLNQTTEQPLRQLIGHYYSELKRQQSVSNLYVFDRMGLAISTCLRENGIVLSPDNAKRVERLLALDHILYR